MSCKYTDEEIKKILECCSKSDCENCTRDWSYVAQWDCMRHIERLSLDLINRQQSEIDRLSKENDELKNEFFQEHYKETECQELLGVTEAWRKESLHNIELESEIERLKVERDKEHDYCNHYARMLAKSETEVIKEFSEKLKEEQEFFENECGEFVGYVAVSRIDNLAKEKVGDTE